MLPWGARVTCYPGQGKAKQSKADAMRAKPIKAKQWKAASNDDDDDEDLTETHTWTCPSLRPIPLNGATLVSTSLLNVRCARVTCYPGARVPHVTQGRAKLGKAKLCKSNELSN